MNSLLSINFATEPKTLPPTLATTFTSPNLPSSLVTYYTCILNNIDVSNQKIGEYVTGNFNVSYNNSSFISTDTNFTNSQGKIGKGSFSSTDSSFNALTGVYAINRTLKTTYNLPDTIKSITIAFWVKLNSGNTADTSNQWKQRGVFNIGGYPVWIYPELYINSTNNNFKSVSIYCSGSGASTTVESRWNPGNTSPALPTTLMTNWNHFCFILKQGPSTQSQTIFINNTKYINNFTTKNDTTNMSMLNSFTTTGITMPGNLNAMVNELRIYNTAITDTQVSNIYNWTGVGQPTH
jgi:hypothetical protein